MASSERSRTEKEWLDTLEKTEHGLLVAKIMVVCATTDRMLLLVRNTDPEIVYTRRGLPDLPGGYARRGEKVRQTASRELLEEGGLDAPPYAFSVYPGAVHTCDEHGRELDIRLARLRVAYEFEADLRGGQGEHTGFFWATEPEAHKWLADDAITAAD